MNVGSIGVLPVTPSTATSAHTQPALENEQDAPGVKSIQQDDDRRSPPPGLGKFVDKTA
jgi:hypothetical protein